MTYERLLKDQKYKGEITRIRNIMYSMRSRCYNPNVHAYASYGGRGITICDEWMDKDNGATRFVQWAIENGYLPGLTIDRIDPNGSYEPSNCRWVSRSVNSWRTGKNMPEKAVAMCIRFDKERFPDW